MCGSPLDHGELILRDPGPKRRGDLLGDLALDVEYVGQLAVVGLGPQVVVRSGIDELADDSDLVSRTANAAFEDRGDVQLPADLLKRPVAVLVPHDRGARDHLQVADPG